MDETTTTGEDHSTDIWDEGSKTEETTPTDGQTPANAGDNLEPSESTNVDDENTKEEEASETESETQTPVQFDTDLDEWAAKTKRPVPQSDTERTYLQELRNSQREFTRSKQQKESLTDISKSISESKPAVNNQDEDEIDPVEAKLDLIERQFAEERNTRIRSEYFSDKQVSTEETKAMGEVLKEVVAKGGQAAYDYWTNPENLSYWHSLAKERLNVAVDTNDLTDEAKATERERIARETQANSSTRASKQTTTSKPKTDDERRNELWS